MSGKKMRGRVYCSGTTKRGTPCCKTQSANAVDGKGGWRKLDDGRWFCDQHTRQARSVGPGAVTVIVNGVQVTIGGAL